MPCAYEQSFDASSASSKSDCHVSGSWADVPCRPLRAPGALSAERKRSEAAARCFLSDER